MNNWLLLVALLCCALSVSGVFQGQDGVVIINALSTTLTGFWERATVDGKEGALWDGESNNYKGRQSDANILEYQFTVDQNGDYYVSLHTARSKTPEHHLEDDEGNDCFISLYDGDKQIRGPTKLFTHFGSDHNVLKWGINFDANHEIFRAQLPLKTNVVYTLRIAGRSVRYFLRRIVLHLEEKKSRNRDDYADVPESPQVDIVNPPPPVAISTTEAPKVAPTESVSEPPTPAITGPGLIPAESFIDRVDLTDTNQGGALCGNSQSSADGNLVDMEVAKDSNSANPGGCNIGWIQPGESVTYQVAFSGTTTYTLFARVAGKQGTKSFEVFTDDEPDARATISFSATGAWQRYTTASASLGTVTEGSHTIRIEFKSGGQNLHYLDIVPESAARGSITSGALPLYASFFTLFVCIIQAFFL